jgi:hypothetical protein
MSDSHSDWVTFDWAGKKYRANLTPGDLNVRITFPGQLPHVILAWSQTTPYVPCSLRSMSNEELRSETCEFALAEEV